MVGESSFLKLQLNYDKECRCSVIERESDMPTCSGGNICILIEIHGSPNVLYVSFYLEADIGLGPDLSAGEFSAHSATKTSLLDKLGE